MRVAFTDTDPAAERLQVALLRAAGTTRRLALAPEEGHAAEPTRSRLGTTAQAQPSPEA